MQCAPVDRDKHVARDRLIARLGVRQRTVRAGSDDRLKARPFGTELAHPMHELNRDLTLAAAHETAFEQPRQRLVSKLRRGTDQRDLGGVLDRAQPLDRAVTRHELPSLREQLREPPVGAHGELALIEAQTTAACAAQ